METVKVEEPSLRALVKPSAVSFWVPSHSGVPTLKTTCDEGVSVEGVSFDQNIQGVLLKSFAKPSVGICRARLGG